MSAKPTGRPATKKTAKTGAGKKRGRPARRSRKAKADRRVWFAFAAGLVLALLLAAAGYTLYGLLGESPRSGAVRRPAVATTEPQAPSKAPKVPAGRKGAAPSSPVAPSAPQAPEEADESPSSDQAVQQALAELRALPFEEPLTPSTAELVGRIDYALLQTMRVLDLSENALLVTATSERIHHGEPYALKTVDVHAGAALAVFERELGRNLHWWAENARLEHGARDLLRISVNGLPTHVLRLYADAGPPPETAPVTQTAPVPQTADSGLRPPSPTPEARPLAPERLRLPGEEPRLVIVIDDLGAGMGPVRRLLALDYPVTFAFWPHAAHAREGAIAAHAGGKEILVHLPMEPEGYPKVKPGPGVLLRNASAEEIRRLTDRGIEAVPYAVGLNNHMGSRFTRGRANVRVVLEELQAKRMFMLDSLTHPRSVFYDEARRMGLTALRRDVFLDNTISRQAILASLRRAEETALITGRAVAIGHPYPETLGALKEWERMRNPKVKIVRLQDLVR